MRKQTLATLLFGFILFTAVSNINACPMVWRSYFVDKHCNLFYVNDVGNRVYVGKFEGTKSTTLVGLPLKQDGHGHWFYLDSFGNKIYVVHGCK